MHPILKLVAQRLALGIILLFAASALIFGLTEILPGDAAQAQLGQAATPESLANLREEMGLNRPALTRYTEWIGGMLTGDMGNALSNKLSISEQIGKRLGATIFLASWAALISVPLAILLGLIAVRYQNRWPDKVISGSTLTFISLPEFMLAYILIFVIGVKLQWAPSFANVSPDMPLLDKLHAISLPVTVLTLVVLAHMMRMTRAAILNVMQSAYIETAELKGLTTFEVIRKHAFPNAIAPIVNVVMLNLAYLVVGVVVVEAVFAYPGMGQYLVDAVVKRDVPVVLTSGVIFAAVYIVLNMIADVVSILSNPRLRHPK
ncbi:Glutathione transport system permease protein GsiC [Ascidiaceihabitans donghaensis]|uniref:Glutathione transport system permease protein GsiC n=1 Tax=Ascidiaceihabitans donghaensis TaxID=1510460 RepID=A0A2R8BGR1_9RHOB|nr:ABC transporter permease [Ascidiaceihabitans donghaensis]SPH22166.1 Glutathione transport system permease protein GsiC [Ascidiaceihabitans donghaensis]